VIWLPTFAWMHSTEAWASCQTEFFADLIRTSTLLIDCSLRRESEMRFRERPSTLMLEVITA